MAIALSTHAFPASAGLVFTPFSAAEAVRQGVGGSSVSRDGVEFWTLGSPDRRHRILGYLVDQRSTGKMMRNPVGDRAVTARIKELGGDAAILIGERTERRRSGGPMGTIGMSAHGTGISIPLDDRITSFAVIKYVPEGSAAR